MTDPTATIETGLHLARATLANSKHASDGDLLRACATVIEHGNKAERACARDLATLIEGDQRHQIEDDGMITVRQFPAVHGAAAGVM